jgi:XRE family transcriptional regulator, fatty acid utilization regulator
VAEALGLNNRQSVGQIEAGQRRVTPEELVRLGAFFGVPVTSFTDRFEPLQSIAFSFRATKDDPSARAAFGEKASRWLTLFAELGREQHVGGGFLRSVLGLSETSSYEDAQAAGEEVARELRLGEFPGARLAEVLDGTRGVLLLHVIAPEGISGAAAHLERFGAVLVNVRDSPGRRNFDIAHELFHILTWDRMPPEELEFVDANHPGPGGGRRPNGRVRREQLADNFAAGLLMPASVVKVLWTERAGEANRPDPTVVGWLASRFRVSAPAVAWRLHNLGLLDRDDLPPDSALSRAAEGAELQRPPLLFNREFVDRVRVALEHGTLSSRRAARILDLDSAGLSELFRSYGMPPPYEA